MADGALALAWRQTPPISLPGRVPERRLSSDSCRLRAYRSAQSCFDVSKALEFGNGDFNPLRHLIINTCDADGYLDAAAAQSSFIFVCQCQHRRS